MKSLVNFILEAKTKSFSSIINDIYKGASDINSYIDTIKSNGGEPIESNKATVSDDDIKKITNGSYFYVRLYKAKNGYELVIARKHPRNNNIEMIEVNKATYNISYTEPKYLSSKDAWLISSNSLDIDKELSKTFYSKQH